MRIDHGSSKMHWVNCGGASCGCKRTIIKAMKLVKMLQCGSPTHWALACKIITCTPMDTTHTNFTKHDLLDNPAPGFTSPPWPASPCADRAEEDARVLAVLVCSEWTMCMLWQSTASARPRPHTLASESPDRSGLDCVSHLIRSGPFKPHAHVTNVRTREDHVHELGTFWILIKDGHLSSWCKQPFGA